MFLFNTISIECHLIFGEFGWTKKESVDTISVMANRMNRIKIVFIRQISKYMYINNGPAALQKHLFNLNLIFTKQQ